MKSRKLVAFTTSIAALASAFSMTGCSMQSKSGKTVITMISSVSAVISTTRISLTRNCSWTYPTLRELTISNQLICR